MILLAPLITPLGVLVDLLIIGGGGFLLYQKYKKEHERKTEIEKSVEAGLADWFKKNGLVPSMNGSIELKTRNTHILAMPIQNSDLLVLVDVYNNMRYTIRKGSIRSYHGEVNGAKTVVRGGFGFGIGLAKGGVESIKTIKEYISLNNIDLSLIILEIGRDVRKDEFEKVGEFVNRLEAMLNLYI